MPFVSNMPDEEQKNQSQGQVAPGGASNTVQTQPGAGVGSTGAPGAMGSSNSQTGGGFASLNQYVNANQGQAEPLANKITSGINQQYNTLAGQNQSTLQGLQGSVDQGYTKQNQDILAQESANPVSFASNPSNIQSFQAQANDKYTGPASAEGSGAFQTQLGNVNNAISEGQAATQTEAGRKQLLAQNEATPNAGVTGLNSAILSQDPNAQGQIEQAYNPFSNLVSGLNTGAQGIDTNIGQAQTQATNASNAANAQIAGQIGNLNTAVNNTATQDTANQNAYNQQLSAYQNQWTPLSQDINAWNSASPNAPMIVSGNLTNPFTSALSQSFSNNQYSPANVATTDQYAQGTAFNSLINGLNTGLPSAVVSGTPSDPALQAPPTFNNPNVNLQDIYNQGTNQWTPGVQGSPAMSDQYNQISPAWNNLIAQLEKDSNNKDFLPGYLNQEK
jgi:hypothetical protein